MSLESAILPTGFGCSRSRDDLNFGQLMMVYQHHERMDGSGYPVGVSEKPESTRGRNSARSWTCMRRSPVTGRIGQGCRAKETIAILDRQAGARLNPRTVAMLEEDYSKLLNRLTRCLVNAI